MILNLEINGTARKLELTPGPEPGIFHVILDPSGDAPEHIEADARILEPGVLSLLINGRAYRCLLQGGEEPTVTIAGHAYAYRIDDPRSLRSRRARADSSDGARAVKASMPGRVVRVLVEVGAEVEAQQGLLIIEAMKMQNELKAPKAGRIAELRVKAGEAVASGQVLAVVE